MERLNASSRAAGQAARLDPAGNLTKSALPNTETEDRAYDRAGRLTAVTSTKAAATVTKTALTLSAAGLPRRVDVTRANVGTGGYDLTYDAARPAASPPAATRSPGPPAAPRAAPRPTPTTRSATD
ncbi:hypothetical protein [Streptomyces sp. NPDC059142]|uniref:hypothetical protein n=1 Tax=Streptomyces sp. NPDC059142 TaxID=3346739 RepID=UPI0036879881